MNCTMALELLLDAEPAELVVAAESPLVAHLRACARCRAVAGRLHAETMRLGEHALERPSAFVSRAAKPTRWRRVGAIAAAAVVLVTFTVWTASRSDAPTAAGNPQAAHLTAAPAASQPSVAGLVQVVAEPMWSMTASAEVVASAGSPSQNVGETRGISVVPPPGMRAMVFATRDPGITIVWLQADDSLRTPR